MKPDRRFNPLVTHGKFKPRPKELSRARATDLFNRWTNGMTYEQIGKRDNLTADEVRDIIKYHLEVLWVTLRKWKLAEVKCHALAMELRLLRIGKEAEPDRPIETINPPAQWLRVFKAAGIDTVNQLRAVDDQMLLAHWQFPRAAIDWAVMKLDMLGLSHVLVRPKIARRRRMAPLMGRVER